jgi:hypothetical protein
MVPLECVENSEAESSACWASLTQSSVNENSNVRPIETHRADGRPHYRPSLSSLNSTQMKARQQQCFRFNCYFIFLLQIWMTSRIKCDRHDRVKPHVTERGRDEGLSRNKELHNLYSSPDIVRMVKSRSIRWAGHVARVEIWEIFSWSENLKERTTRKTWEYVEG